MLSAQHTYYYFGKLGFLCLYILGRLEKINKENNQEKIKIITFEDFAELINSNFSHVAEASSHHLAEYLRPFASQGRVKKNGDSLLEAFLEEGRFLHNCLCLSTEMFEIFENDFARPEWIRKPLSHKTIDNSNIINIYSRLYEPEHIKNNLAPSKIKKIINLCLKNKNIKVVIHGHWDNSFGYIDEHRVIRSQGLLDSISYLHQSKLCICCESGFAAFAFACQCPVVSFNHRQFTSVTPEMILGNCFQVYADTISFCPSVKFPSMAKLKTIIDRIFS